MLVSEINNHTQQALARLLQQYQGLPRMTGLITALVNQIQLLENATYSLDQGRQLAFAVGQQLDNLGEIIGIKRNGLSDSEYLVFLYGTIAENYSDTTARTMANIVATIFSVPTALSIPFYPAEMAFEVPNSTPVTESLWYRVYVLIQNSLGGGINLGFIAQYPAAPNASFQFTKVGFPPVGGGFSDLANPDTGGGFAELIYNSVGIA